MHTTMLTSASTFFFFGLSFYFMSLGYFVVKKNRLFCQAKGRS